jgi:signal transduction histidine kinase
VVSFVLATCLGLFVSGVVVGVLESVDPVLAPTAPDGVRLAVDVVFGLSASVALWLRRRWPVVLTAVVLPMQLVSLTAGGAALVFLLTVAVRRRPLVAWVSAAVSVAVNVGYYLLWYHVGALFWLPLVWYLLLNGLVVFWGMFVRARRQLLESLRERAERAEAEQQLRVAQAQHLERTRIAREMHDVLAHRISMLSLHAGALEYAPDAPAPHVARAAGVIRDSAHAALQDLRQVIGVLRADPGRGEVDPSTSERPLPGLADVPTLIDESRAAGMRIDLHDRVTGPGSVPDQVGRSAYRIVQEGLTNARKHAPGTLVTVVLTGAPGTGLTIEIRNPALVGAPVAWKKPPGTGTGLIGVAERVHLAGGTVTHGTDSTGGFRLTATLPWTVEQDRRP